MRRVERLRRPAGPIWAGLGLEGRSRVALVGLALAACFDASGQSQGGCCWDADGGDLCVVLLVLVSGVAEVGWQQVGLLGRAQGDRRHPAGDRCCFSWVCARPSMDFGADGRAGRNPYAVADDGDACGRCHLLGGVI